MSTTTSQPSILNSLNNAQRRAVTSNASTVAILAGPGSGKTHTLTSRVVWLIQHAGYQPANVIVATFTVKAAREMKERIGKALGEGVEKKIVLGTFHSIARRYLATYGTRIGLDPKFGIADDGDTKAIIQRICKRLEADIEPSYVKSWISKRKSKGSIEAVEATVRNPKKPREHPALQECFREYQTHLSRSNLLDYDDLLVRCVELLRNHPHCVSNVQSVLIDEYQDTNGIQYELMRLFAQAQSRITIVGDPDQSIYGWRSAEIRNLYRLLRDFPETDEVSLEENYRSSQSILNVSLNVIQQDKNRYQKVLLPVHTKGAKPVLRKLKSSSAEGEWIVTEIKRTVMMFGGMLKHEDIAILLRSAALSRHVESALGKAGIPYRMIGGRKFYERKEIKVLLDYLRVVYQPDNNDAVARIVNVPRRGIGEATIKSLLEEAERSKMSLWSLLWRHCRGGRQAATNIRNNMEQKLNTGLLKVISSLRQKVQDIGVSTPVTLVDLIEQLVSQLSFKKHLEEEYADDHEQRWANVQEFLNLARDFVRDYSKIDDDDLPDIEEMEQVKQDDVLGRFLANVALASDAQKDDKDQKQNSLVTISTIHAAKGLEWPMVFIPSVYTGSIPHARSEDSDEERRLLYVAMTRAKALLYLSCPLFGSQGMGSKVELSPFISPFAAAAFSPKGPTLDRPVIESAAKILGREAPTEKVIFGNLPAMFSPEDDLFPVDPIDSKNRDEYSGDPNTQYARPPKRQRTNYAGDQVVDSEDQHWRREYETTMEQTSGFTMASLPGFTTAGAHQKVLNTTAAAAAEAEKKPSPKPIIRGGTTRRPANQRSLLGFVRQSSNPDSLRPKNEGDSFSASRHQAAAARHLARTTTAPAILAPSKPAIDPSLASHKLAHGKTMPQPNLPKLGNEGPRKQYPGFSSSPSRPASPEPKAEHKAEAEAAAAAAMLDKPAASFHTTTFMATKKNGGVRRPVGMGPPPTMDRLRKPFKPLTINRPGRP